MGAARPVLARARLPQSRPHGLFVKIAPPKPEKFPILRLYPLPGRITGPSQRSYLGAQKTDRTGRP